MKNRNYQRVGNRRTTTFNNGVMSTTDTRVNYSVSSFSVITDVTTKPADRSQEHPHEYSKADYYQNWCGKQTEVSSNGRDFTEVVGPQPYTVNEPYSLPVGFAGMQNLFNECLSKVNETLRGNIDLAVTLAEAGQTVNLQRTAVKLTKAVLGWKRTFGRKAFTNVPDLSSEAWLSWQYGVRPIINDLYGAADNLKRTAANCMVVKKRAKQLTILNISKTQTFGTGNVPVRGVEWLSQRVEIKYVLVMDDTVLARLGNWTSLNPASIAWELVPYSFVADWVFDIGSYLRNMESAFLYKDMFKRGYTTYTWKAGKTLKAFGTTSGSGGSKVYTDFYMARVDSAKRRVVNSNVSMPYPPTFDVKLGWQRLASAASLIWQGGSRVARR